VERKQLGGNEITVLHRFIQIVGIRRHTGFQIEQAVRIPIDLILGSGSQADQQRIKVVEYRTVLLKHTSVRFVDHHQIKMPHAKTTTAVLCFVNEAHHRWIGRNVNAAFGILFGNQVYRARIG